MDEQISLPVTRDAIVILADQVPVADDHLIRHMHVGPGILDRRVVWLCIDRNQAVSGEFEKVLRSTRPYTSSCMYV